MTAGDRQAFARLLERTFGRGFRLVVVELRTPSEGDALVAWVRAQVPTAQVHPVDARGAFAENPLRALDEAGTTPNTVLVLRGLEQSERELPTDHGALRALNVQRDVLVGRHPCFWVVVLHPTLVARARNEAADFLDFASLWVEADSIDEQASAALPPREQELRIWSPVRWEGVSDVQRAWLDAAWEAAGRGERDRVEDLLARVVIAGGAVGPQIELVHGFAGLYTDNPADLTDRFERLLGVHVAASVGAAVALGRTGEWARALDLLDRAVPEDERWALEVADTRVGILLQFGRFAEAIRVCEEQLIPGWTRVGSTRDVAIANQKRASALLRLGRHEEALQLLRTTRESLDGDDRRALDVSIAEVLLEEGHADAALDAIRTAAIPNGSFLHTRALLVGGVSLAALGDASAALTAFEEVSKLSAVAGDAHLQRAAEWASAGMLVRTGHVEQGLERLARLRPGVEHGGSPREMLMLDFDVARALVLGGEHDLAIATMRDKVIPCLYLLGPNGRVNARMLLASALYGRGRGADRRRARDLLDEALADLPAGSPQRAEILATRDRWSNT